MCSSSCVEERGSHQILSRLSCLYSAPYEEILESVRCPRELLEALKHIWTVRRRHEKCCRGSHMLTLDTTMRVTCRILARTRASPFSAGSSRTTTRTSCTTHCIGTWCSLGCRRRTQVLERRRTRCGKRSSSTCVHRRRQVLLPRRDDLGAPQRPRERQRAQTLPRTCSSTTARGSRLRLAWSPRSSAVALASRLHLVGWNCCRASCTSTRRSDRR